MTIGAALREATQFLRSIDPQEASFEARLMVAHLLKTSAPALAAMRENPWPAELNEQLERMLQRRRSREPLQYILGEWSFMGLPMSVRPGVLIPRADTEIVAEQAVRLIRARGYRDVLDVCAGSGCIGVSLARLTGVRVVSVDIHPDCCALTRENASQNGVCVDVRRGDLFDPLRGEERFDLIVSNPPYLTAADLAHLQPEVAFEPRLALDGGEDGLLFYRRIAAGFKPHLRKDGALLLEIGCEQGASVSAMFENAEILYDYEQRPRAIQIENTNSDWKDKR